MARFTPKKGQQPTKKPAARPRTQRAATPPVKKLKDWRPAFLKALAAGSTVMHAAAAAGVSRQAVYQARDKDPVFKGQFKDAETDSAEILEAEARRRAIDGVETHVVHKGEVVMVGVDADGKVCPAFHVVDGQLEPNPDCVASRPLMEREYSDTLLIFLLKGRRRDVFGDRLKVDDESKLRTAAEGEAAATDLLARLRARLGADCGGAARDPDAV